MVRHIVWDWNGTLFDDAHLMAAAVDASCRAIGHPRVTIDDYRTHHVRPLTLAYERLLGRTPSPEEWRTLFDVYSRTYESTLVDAQLAVDAIEALGRVDCSDVSQSVLSMWHHERLVDLIESKGIAHFFSDVQGQLEINVEPKVESLARHLETVGYRAAEVLLVGDVSDDGDAARDVGMKCVLVTTGAQHRVDLEATGWPVVDSLTEALDAIGLESRQSIPSKMTRAAAPDRVQRL